VRRLPATSITKLQNLVSRNKSALKTPDLLS
jgi:hypothetical protein